MNRLVIPVLAAVAVSVATLGAQVTVSVSSNGGSATAGSQTNTLPFGPITTGSASAWATATSGACFTSSQATIWVVTDGAHVVSESNGNDPTYWGCALPGRASASASASFSAAAPVAGMLELRAWTTNSASYRVQVGGTGSSVAFQATGSSSNTYRVPVVVGTDPLPVSISTSVTLATPTIAWSLQDRADVTCTFVPGAAGLATRVAPCGPELTAYVAEPPSSSLRHFAFLAANSAVTPHAFFVLGLTPLNAPIPPYGCLIGTDFVIVGLTTVDPSGRARLVGPLPKIPAAFLVQYLAATLDPSGNPLWRTSNVVQVSVQ